MKAIEEAEESLLQALKDGEEIPPRDLRRRVQEDSSSEDGLEANEVSLAFWRLLNRGEIVLTEELTVRRAEPLRAA